MQAHGGRTPGGGKVGGGQRSTADGGPGGSSEGPEETDLVRLPVQALQTRSVQEAPWDTCPMLSAGDPERVHSWAGPSPCPQGLPDKQGSGGRFCEEGGAEPSDPDSVEAGWGRERGRRPQALLGRRQPSRGGDWPLSGRLGLLQGAREGCIMSLKVRTRSSCVGTCLVFASAHIAQLVKNPPAMPETPV